MALIPGRPARLLVVAAAGYGKTTAIDEELPLDALRLTAEEALTGPLPAGAPWLAVDGLERLDEHDLCDLLGRVDALPERTGVALLSRRPLPPVARRRLTGRVLERTAGDLALREYDVARLLAEEYDRTDPELAVDVHRVTGGWPGLVHLVADRLPRAARSVDVGPAAEAVRSWLETQVLDQLPPADLEILRRVLALGPVVPELWRLVAESLGDGALEVQVAATAIGRLEDLGVLLPAAEGGHRPVPVVGRCLWSEPDAALLVPAAATYETVGLWSAAASAHRAAGDHDAVLRLVERHGDDMLRRGCARDLLELTEPVDVRRSERVAMLRADARRMVGDAAGAGRELAPLVRSADEGGRWSRDLATRASTVPFLLGDAATALTLLDRCPPPSPAEDVAEVVDWLSQRTHCLGVLGRTEEAEESAREALRRAEEDGSPRALLAAHVSAARVSRGARKEAHHERAAELALGSGDLLTLARVRTNQAHLLLASARYADAVEPARQAVAACEAVSPPGMLCVAVHNLAEALARTGELEEAGWQYGRGVALGGRLGPGRSALGMLGTAQVRHELGKTEAARAAYRDAADLARRTGEVQVLVPALSGLARLECEPAIAEEALRAADASTRPWALAAAAWVARRRGEADAARRLAAEAVAGARDVGALDQLAEALEVAAVTTDDPATARSQLQEARAVWTDGGASPARSRVEVLMARLPGADALERARGRAAAAYLQRLGVVEVDGLPLTAEPTPATVRIQVLGGFTVLVDGDEVPLTAWRSRQARTLVKLLVARRGRPVTRAALAEVLWPDDDPARTAHRLSVLLATVRGVLDQHKRWPSDRFVASDKRGVWLHLAHVSVDAEDLLRDVAQAIAAHDAGQHAAAAEILSAVECHGTGEALADEDGEPWADQLREEVRAAWVRALQLLVTLRREQGRGGEVTRLLVRLLALDPYDERAHRQLVRTLVGARRYGEARRAFERWTAAMTALDAPLPDPAVLDPLPRRRAVLTPL